MQTIIGAQFHFDFKLTYTHRFECDLHWHSNGINYFITHIRQINTIKTPPTTFTIILTLFHRRTDT